VHYQPVVDLDTDRVTAMEALARWRHPDGEVVSPAVFVPIAEECGLIQEIGREVLRQACRAVRRWRDTVPGSERLTVAVNVSGRQLLSGDLSIQVAEALADSGIPAEALTLEITESTLLEDSDTVVAMLGRIKALGVRLAMDDFGTGYSSLGALLRFDVDLLKIDRTLLDFDTSSEGSLVQAVTDLGRQLGLTIVAEGVESARQLARVRAAGCDAAQGYYLARPMPESDVRSFLAPAAAPAVHVVDSAAVGERWAARTAG
jgi:EAL domain-containing protein (putative c-di-GMP-specific phosphodiesterase class I)